MVSRQDNTPFVMGLNAYRKEIFAIRDCVGLALASIVVALVSVLIISVIMEIFGLFGTDMAFIIQYTAIQVGFLPLALAYLSFRQQLWSHINIHLPTIRDIGWILLIPVTLVVVSVSQEPLLSILGLSGTEAAVPESPNILEQPTLLLLVFVWWYLIAAPSEELLFRGVIQNQLREKFNALSGVILASFIFVIPHIAFVLIDGGGSATILMQAIQTFVGGLMFGIAYERTDNIIVPAIGHAMMWTMVLFIV